MEYTVQKLAEIAGISPRTLRFYDEKGLLKPQRINSSGYRIYSSAQINLLHQIMLYKEMGLPLEEIKEIIYSENFDPVTALENHLKRLHEKRRNIDWLIENVELSIAYQIGEYKMSDSEKFKALKKKLADENDKKYGEEIRERYSERIAKESSKKFMNMSEADYNEMNAQGEKIISLLKDILAGNNENGETEKQLAEIHKKWLMFTWSEYSKEAHTGLVQMYVMDERFAKYYDSAAGIGAAEALRDAVHKYIDEI